MTRLVALLGLMLPLALQAQVRPLVQDTTRRDTVQFTEPDSVIAALLQKPGYVATRYEGGMVTFDATAKAFAIAAASLNRAIVEREGQRVVTDSGGSITYNWNAKKAAPGPHTILVTARDAAGNSSSQQVQVTRK